jgi:alpha-tubulin suppressor-like RCC1 family protein
MTNSSLHARATLGILEALMTRGSTWFRLLTIAVAAGLFGAACTDGLTDIDSEIRVTVTPEVSTLASLGEQVQLGAKVDVTRGAAPSPMWLTRDVDVAAVGDDGRVRAIGNGETWIVVIVEANGFEARDSARIVVAQVPVAIAVTPGLDTLTWFGQTARLVAVAQDARGNPVADAPLAWTSSDPAAVRVDSAGTVTAVADGGATITVSAGEVRASITLAVAQQVTSVTVAPTSAAVTVGATQQFTATARDAGGSTVAGVKFLWVSANVNVAVVDTTGLARGTGAGAVTITAVGRGEPGNAVLNVGSVPSTPTQLAFSVQPSTSTAGQALSPAVEVEIRDANGNLVTGARNAVTLALGTNPGGGTLAGTRTVAAVNGIASFSGLWIDKAAAGYTLAASATSLTGATSGTFTVNPGPPTKLAFGQQPTNAQGNVAFAPAVTVTISDAFSNVVTTATNPITVDLGVNVWKSVFAPGAMLIGTKTVNAVNGVATFSGLRVDKPGAGYTMVTTAAGLTGAGSDPFSVNLTVQQVRAAKMGNHTCAVTSGGTYCWGAGWDGQLGDGLGTFTSDSVARLVSGGLTFTQVSGGGAHSCGLTAAGAAYCWGANWNGQLGNNSTTRSDVPVAVAGGLTFSSISAGAEHTCGVVGTAAYCWGYDGLGQLGDDANLTNRLVPTLVAGGLAWASVTPGAYHTCGLTTGGSAYCWGYDGYGGLGNDASLTNQPTPVVVAGGRTWGTVNPGYYHTCGVDVNGAGFCWGTNYSGVLGADTTTYARNSTQATPVPVFGALTFATIGTGSDHSCGLTTSGAAYCWGYNGYGQLGDGTTVPDSPLRVAVIGGLTFNTLSAGGAHTCGRVGTAAWCWGYGYSGQLGNGAAIPRNQPVQIVQ